MSRWRLRPVPALLALLLAPPALAQELGFDPAPAQACMAASRHQTDASCIGDAARACMDASGEGETTVVVNGCLSFEAAWWDARLNEEYGALMPLEARMDSTMGPPPVLSGADALREMQRAWVAYRDARCAWEATAYSGGTGAGPAFNGCTLAETARQTLLLAERRHALENQ